VSVPLGWGSVGVWLSRLGLVRAAEARAAVRRIEELGYGSLWVGETSVSKEAMTHAALLLAASDRIVVATGIASIWARDAVATHAAGVTLGEAHPGRFVLGLGVSHRDLVGDRGHRYDRPLAAMRQYLDDLQGSRCDAPVGDVPAPIVLAALGPKMLTLAGERTAGAHTYFMPVGHTRRARELLGPDRLLVPEQAVVVTDRPDEARARARQHMAFYLGQPNYVQTLRTMGLSAEDLAGGGSDRLVDTLVAWGPVEVVVQRVRDQLAAGADHVVLQPLGPTTDAAVDQLQALAPALTDEFRRPA
jgi:probable F420-dependent oxidoreductase